MVRVYNRVNLRLQMHYCLRHQTICSCRVDFHVAIFSAGSTGLVLIVAHRWQTEDCVLICLFTVINTLRSEENACHFEDDIFKCIFLNWKCCILITISPKFVCKCLIHNISTLFQVLARYQPGNKQLSEPILMEFADTYTHYQVVIC